MTASVVMVLYRTASLDLRWLPSSATVYLVHNDDSDPPVDGSVVHLRPGTNLGFGAAVNLALAQVRTERVLVVNPDMDLAPEHWTALTDAHPAEIVTLPVLDREGGPTSILNRYYTPLALVLTAMRIGRFMRRSSVVRRRLVPFLGRWGRGHAASLTEHAPAVVSMREWWVSGAALSVATERLHAIGGFDESYFLYYEDVDLCQRLAAAFPEMSIRVADSNPARHAVGGSVTDRETRLRVRAARLQSARRYASKQVGMRWRVASTIVGVLAPLIAR